MPIVYSHQEAYVQVAVWHATESFDALCGRLSADVAARLLTASFQAQPLKRRTERVAAHILLAEMLGKSLYITHDADGKPALPAPFPDISITHSGAHIGIQLHKATTAGLDIERIQPRIKQLSSRFLQADDLDVLASSAFDAYDPYFPYALAWCAKEAGFKAADKAATTINDLKLHLVDVPARFIKVGLRNTTTAFTFRYTLLHDDMVLVYRL